MPRTSAQKKTVNEPSYADFIATLQLYSIGLAETNCSINRPEFWKKEKANINYQLISKASDIGDEAFDAKSTLTLAVTGEKSKTQAVQITVAFDLHFHAKIARKEFVEKFCESEIRLIVWPYFREYVSNTIARMHIPPVILPISNKEE